MPLKYPRRGLACASHACSRAPPPYGSGQPSRRCCLAAIGVARSAGQASVHRGERKNGSVGTRDLRVCASSTGWDVAPGRARSGAVAPRSAAVAAFCATAGAAIDSAVSNAGAGRPVCVVADVFSGVRFNGVSIGEEAGCRSRNPRGSTRPERPRRQSARPCRRVSARARPPGSGSRSAGRAAPDCGLPPAVTRRPRSTTAAGAGTMNRYCPP
jgi:hypothetical protein